MNKPACRRSGAPAAIPGKRGHNGTDEIRDVKDRVHSRDLFGSN